MEYNKHALVKSAALHSKHRFIVRCKIYFDVLNRLGVDHECDGQTDGQTESSLALVGTRAKKQHMPREGEKGNLQCLAAS